MNDLSNVSRPSLLKIALRRPMITAASVIAALGVAGTGTYVMWPKAPDRPNFTVNADGDKETAEVKISQVRDLKNNVRKLIGSKGEIVVVFGGVLPQAPSELVGKKIHVYVPLTKHETYGNQYQVNSPDQVALEGKEKK